MTIVKIKRAVDGGKIVQWCTPSYRVIKDRKEQYLIQCLLNGACWGLTNIQEDRLNGDESEFKIIG